MYGGSGESEVTRVLGYVPSDRMASLSEPQQNSPNTHTYQGSGEIAVRPEGV